MSNLTPSELHRQILQELRKYSATSVVDAAMHLLWQEHSDAYESLMILPWNILLLAKWALRDESTLIRIGRVISTQEFENLRAGVHELVERSHLVRKPPPHLMMRSHFQQFDFQRSEGWGFLRWPALIARQDAQNASRRQFVQVLGLPPEHFIDLTLSLIAAVHAKHMPVPRTYFDTLRPAYGNSIDAFEQLVALDLPALRYALREDAQASPTPLHQELYEFPHVKRYPFFKLRNGSLMPWHRMVVARGLEEIVHWRLARLGGRYTEPFSRIFEGYVSELAQSMSPSCVLEDQYEVLAGSSAPMVEAIIPYGSCNVLVEAKMALFGDDVLLTDNESQAFQKTKKVRDAIKQAWKVGKAVRSGESVLPQCASASQDFLLVVTSRELGLGSGEQLQRLYPPGSLSYPDDATARNLPLENVFTLSILDFERLATAVAGGDIDLPKFLASAVQKNRDPATSAILFDQFMATQVRSWGTPDLLLKAQQASQRRLAQAFGAQEDENE